MNITLNGRILGTITKVDIEVQPLTFVMHFKAADGTEGAASGSSLDQAVSQVIARLHSLQKKTTT